MAVKWTAEQQKVIDARDRNLLVSAAAGSGKTAVLVERILAMVKDPVHPIDIDQLLVVTFTRAAAGEMKERIGRALQQSLAENPENEHLQRQQTLLHHAQISTIHGFCSYVIKNYFQMIDLDPVYRMADEGEIRLMKSDVIQKVMEERFTEKESAFTRFVESYAAGKQDDGLDALVLKLYEFSMSYPWPEQWLEECRAAYQMDSPEAVQESIWVQELMSEAKKRLSSILEGIQENRKTAVSSGGPYLYDEALSSDQQMVEELLDFSRLQNGIKLNCQVLDLVAEATDAALFVEARIRQEGLHFVYAEPPDPYPVWADPARLHQVFINILDNAIKYSEPDGTIFLTLTRRGDSVTAAVRDQGRGIAPDDLEKVKQKFFKAKNSVRGSGIGLAVVDEIITALGGRVDIASTLGQGTTVSITLPVYHPGQEHLHEKI